MSTFVRTCIVLAALGWGEAAHAGKAVLECIADTWSAPRDATPHGRDTELRLPQGGAILLQFRTAAVSGWRVEKATLLLHLTAGRAPRRLRVAALSAPFREASDAGADLPRLRGRRHSVRPYGEGFVAIDLDAGEAAGAAIALFGATPPGARFDSRETVGHAPYLLVEGSP